MSKSIDALEQKIEQLKARRELLRSKERTALRRRIEREAREIGLWMIKNKPEAAELVRRKLMNERNQQIQ
jgi:hypothetical protein